MSWQAYVDQSLVGTGSLDRAAIFNSEGNSVWAQSSGFAVTAKEMKDIATAFKDKGDAAGTKKVQSTGFHVAGEKFITLKADDRSLYGKKGREGVVIVKTKQALLVAHYPSSEQPGVAANVVEKLADYLINAGY